VKKIPRKMLVETRIPARESLVAMEETRMATKETVTITPKERSMLEEASKTGIAGETLMLIKGDFIGIFRDSMLEMESTKATMARETLTRGKMASIKATMAREILMRGKMASIKATMLKEILIRKQLPTNRSVVCVEAPILMQYL
jgi:hypothetical protein